MDRVADMAAFVKVVDSGGFAAAARALNMSPSAVTTHVQSLEDGLGARLLNRTTRHVSLTEAGQAYYDRCAQILADIDDANQVVQELQSKPRGTLRLNTAVSIPPLIAPVIVEFANLYPDASVAITTTGRMIDLVEEGFDLAIRNTPVPDSNLIIRHLAMFRFVACGAPDYLARRGMPESPADLLHHNCLIYSDSPWGKEWHFVTPEGEQAIKLSSNLQANTGDALRLAALLGHGLLYAPRYLLADDLASGRLVPILTKYETAKLSIDAIYPHRRHLPVKVRLFVDLLSKYFRETTLDEAH
jgi:DNA-binding transcriptional LysR family regulator